MVEGSLKYSLQTGACLVTFPEEVSECLDCISENKVCSQCTWKTIIESTRAKEWVYAVIAAEAITDMGTMDP